MPAERTCGRELGATNQFEYSRRNIHEFKVLRKSECHSRQTLESYYEVPPDVLSDPEALLSWAGEAIRAGQSSPSPG
jgi:TfoX/Sxy family transcriptional regulator of competence genes